MKNRNKLIGTCKKGAKKHLHPSFKQDVSVTLSLSFHPIITPRALLFTCMQYLLTLILRQEFVAATCYKFFKVDQKLANYCSY